MRHAALASLIWLLAAPAFGAAPPCRSHESAGALAGGVMLEKWSGASGGLERKWVAAQARNSVRFPLRGRVQDDDGIA